MNTVCKRFMPLAIAAAALLMASCDNIDSDDRFIAVYPENPEPDPPAGEEGFEVPRTLLIEEFTGIQCVNCPDAAKVISELQEFNPGRIISVGLHAEGAGQNTRPLGGFDLRCEEAQVMFKYFNPPGLPCAVFNGTVVSTDYNSWNTYCVDALKEKTPISLILDVSYDAASRLASVGYKIEFGAEVNDDLNIMVWLVENDITGYQLTQTTALADYMHNHVLRASVNGEWGEALGSSFALGQKAEGQSSITLDEAWNAGNCEAVAFVFHSQSKAVEQAASAQIIKN